MNTFVLDTSVILDYGPAILGKFPENSNLVITSQVLQEVSSKRSDPIMGKNVVTFLETIDSLLDDEEDGAILLENECTLTIENFNGGILKFMEDEVDSVLVTKDISMKIYAKRKGFKVDSLVDPKPRVEFEDTEEYQITDEEMNDLYGNGFVNLDPSLDLPINTGVILKTHNASALAVSEKGWRFDLVKPTDKLTKVSVEGKSAEQSIALKHLLNDNITAVSLGGIPGSGKTFLAIGAAVQAVEEGRAKKIIVFRSMQSVGGEELGFLPGTEEEKMDPWSRAVYDVLDNLLTESQIRKYKSRGVIEVLPITHVRGRTFNDCFVIVDEAQNLSKSTILTLLTRMGKNSKAVLTWDRNQRDNPYVGKWDGIYEVVSRLIGQKFFAHVSMKKSERSHMAQEVAKLLGDYS